MPSFFGRRCLLSLSKPSDNLLPLQFPLFQSLPFSLSGFPKNPFIPAKSLLSSSSLCLFKKPREKNPLTLLSTPLQTLTLLSLVRSDPDHLFSQLQFRIPAQESISAGIPDALGAVLLEPRAPFGSRVFFLRRD